MEMPFVETLNGASHNQSSKFGKGCDMASYNSPCMEKPIGASSKKVGALQDVGLDLFSDRLVKQLQKALGLPMRKCDAESEMKDAC